MNEKSPLTAPQSADKVLLHACCAVCAAAIVETMLENGIAPTIYFYNPNIHPLKEYKRRRDEIQKYAKKVGIFFFEGDYDFERWFEVTKGHEKDPERGPRCSLCFEMRLSKTAEFAREKGFKVFTSCLGISRWKDFDQVTQAGSLAASLYPGTTFWDHNWRKQGGSQKMAEIKKRENFYQQTYCGCRYSAKSQERRA